MTEQKKVYKQCMQNIHAWEDDFLLFWPLAKPRPFQEIIQRNFFLNKHQESKYEQRRNIS